jgi:hypothetical protein
MATTPQTSSSLAPSAAVVPRPSLVVAMLVALPVLAHTAALVAGVTIASLSWRPLLPRWDHAGHLLAGWTDAYYVTTLQPVRLLWDLWGQGYWPPGHALFQLPFFALGGGHAAAGPLSSLTAFVLLGLTAAATVVIDRPRRPWPAAALVVLFVATSPFVLAYASVAMMEMLGLLVHAVALLGYVWYDRRRSPAAARGFALSLTAVFFVKYNYLVLLAVPLLAHEYLQRTSGLSGAARLQQLRGFVRSLVAEPIVVFVGVYLCAAVAIELTGGFAFDLGGRRVAVRTIGYSAHPVLYAVLLRLWYLQRHGRLDWHRLVARDPRIRPLLVYFVLPVTVWLASPYPNHIKDVVNLLINTPLGPPTAALGLRAYLDAIAIDYFAASWLLTLALVGLVAAIATWRSQTSLMRLCVLAAIVEFAMVAAHPTRDPRFLATALLPLWLASSGGLGAWIERAGRAASIAAAVVVVGVVVALSRAVVAGAPFQRLAFEHYVESGELREALADLGRLTASHEVAVLGRSDALSPALFRWYLGPPAGHAAFPVEVYRVADEPWLDRVDMVVLAAPLDDRTGPDELRGPHARHTAWLEPRLRRGALVEEHQWEIRDLGARLILFRRSTS